MLIDKRISISKRTTPSSEQTLLLPSNSGEWRVGTGKRPQPQVRVTQTQDDLKKERGLDYGK